jgi:hypothetical protein
LHHRGLQKITQYLGNVRMPRLRPRRKRQRRARWWVESDSGMTSVMHILRVRRARHVGPHQLSRHRTQFHVVALRGFAQRGKREVLISDIVLALKQRPIAARTVDRDSAPARGAVLSKLAAPRAMSD